MGRGAVLRRACRRGRGSSPRWLRRWLRARKIAREIESKMRGAGQPVGTVRRPREVAQNRGHRLLSATSRAPQFVCGGVPATHMCSVSVASGGKHRHTARPNEFAAARIEAVPRSQRPGQLPADRGRDPRALAGRGHLPASRSSSARRPKRVRLLRRPAVRQRAAALRAPAHRLRQGRRAALPDDARPPRRTALRWDCHGLPAEMEAEKELGLRGASRSDAYGIDKYNDACRKSVQKYTGSGALRHAPGALGRLRQRLQDHGPLLHGERAVGVQAIVGRASSTRATA
jgi:hypothetical protein